MKTYAPLPWWSSVSPLAGWHSLGGALLGMVGICLVATLTAIAVLPNYTTSVP